MHIAGGTLLVSPTSTLDGNLQLSGTLGGTADIVVEGLFTWISSGGGRALRGVNGQGSLTSNGGAVLDGITYGYVDHNLEGGVRYINPAGQTIVWTGGHITLSGHSYFDNYGTIQQTFDGGIGSFDSASELNK